jgi:hypothetical protein
MVAASAFGQQSEADVIARLKKDLAEIADLQALLLAPPPDIVSKYSDFLRLPETGLVKLYPRGKRNDVMGPRMDGGAYYSFVRRSHEYGQGNDIELDEQGLFRVGFAGADYGFFVPLGRGEIQSIQQNQEPPTWLSPSARQLWDDAWNYRTPADIQEVRKEQQRVQVQNHTVPRDGVVYLLRSIAPRRSDILVALKVEKILGDGGVVIAWRLLNNWAVPNF